jgi:hypothetical protein
MKFVIDKILATNWVPLRRDGVLIPPTAPLFPNGVPALFLSGNIGDGILSVACTIGNASRSPDGTPSVCLLRGRSGSQNAELFHSKVFKVDGDSVAFELPVFLSVRPRGFVSFQGDVKWELLRVEDDAREIPLAEATTALALNFTSKLPPGAARGVPLEALNALQLALRVSRPDDLVFAEGEVTRAADSNDPINDIIAIVNWVFSTNPPSYDTLVGAPHFVTFSGQPVFDYVRLNYTAYLAAQKDPTAVCNCYDTAAIVQYLVQYSVSIPVGYAYIEPFGYLAPTPLIGVGQCNNPFFKNANYNSNPVCGETDNRRSAFGNHAFANLDSMQTVADACAGPHLGNETQAQYLAVATDGTTPSPPAVGRGKVSNITIYRGVISVSSTMTSNPAISEQGLAIFVEGTGFIAVPGGRPAVRLTALPRLTECPALDGFREVGDVEIDAGFPLVRGRLAATNGSGTLKLGVTVSSAGTDIAQRHYLSLGSLNMAARPVFDRGPAGIGEASAQATGADRARIIWLDRNLVFDLEGFGLAPGIIENCAIWVDRFVRATATSDLDPGRVAIQNLSASSNTVSPGQRVTLSVATKPDYRVFIDGDHPGLYPVAEGKRDFTFEARAPSTNRVDVFAVDPSSLLSAKGEVVISVQ